MLNVLDAATDAFEGFVTVADLNTVGVGEALKVPLREAVSETLVVRDLDMEPLALIVALPLTVTAVDRVIEAVVVRLTDCEADPDVDSVIVAVLVAVRLVDCKALREIDRVIVDMAVTLVDNDADPDADGVIVGVSVAVRLVDCKAVTEFDRVIVGMAVTLVDNDADPDVD